METAVKIVSAVLILFSLFMGVKHGWAMALGKSEVIEMFARWNVSKTAVQVLGAIGLAATVLLLFPRTFVWGNLLTAMLILFVMVQFLNSRDLKGLLIELPFFILPLLLIYLGHPLVKGAP